MRDAYAPARREPGSRRRNKSEVRDATIDAAAQGAAATSAMRDIDAMQARQPDMLQRRHIARAAMRFAAARAALSRAHAYAMP